MYFNLADCDKKNLADHEFYEGQYVGNVRPTHTDT